MALVNCPECGKEVSDKAYSCPACGFPVREHFENINDNFTDSQIVPIDNLQKQKNELIVSPDIEYVTFNFGAATISYPKEFGKYARLYGKYCSIAKERQKYYLMDYTQVVRRQIMINITENYNSFLHHYWQNNCRMSLSIIRQCWNMREKKE